MDNGHLVARAIERFEHHRREMERWAEFLKMCRELDPHTDFDARNAAAAGSGPASAGDPPRS